MEKRTLIMREADEWVKAGIITPEQRQQIESLYPQEKKTSVLPILAAVLFALGVLTFIASNWNGIAPVAKMAIIFLSMSLAYAGGDRLRQKGFAKLGTSLTIIGMTIFGSGFFLIGQMYHLSSNPVNAFYLWFAGALAVVWHYREKTLFLMLQLILFASVFYGELFSERAGITVGLYYLLYGAGILPLLWRFRNISLAAFSLTGFYIAALVDVIGWSEGFGYPLLLLASYFLAQILPESAKPFPQVMRVLSYIGIFLYGAIGVFVAELLPRLNRLDTILAVMMGVLMVWSAYLSIKRKRWWMAGDLIPYAAVAGLYGVWGVWYGSWEDFSYREAVVDGTVLLMISLFAFACSMILSGERLREVYRINLGAILFGASCFVAYVNYAWDFMDKSIFLLLGGFLLFVISFVLERKRRRWVDEARRGAE